MVAIFRSIQHKKGKSTRGGTEVSLAGCWIIGDTDEGTKKEKKRWELRMDSALSRERRSGSVKNVGDGGTRP